MFDQSIVMFDRIIVGALQCLIKHYSMIIHTQNHVEEIKMDTIGILWLKVVQRFMVNDLHDTFPAILLVFFYSPIQDLGTTVYRKISYYILGLLRFWRLRKLKQLFTRLEKDIRFSYFSIRGSRLLSVTLFHVHCAGCFYYIICQYLFLPTVEKIYLFSGVSREILLLLVSRMKAEYIPPREDVIVQNELPDDVYNVVSGEVEMIDVTGNIGEVGALCCRAQSLTFRTKTLSHLLRLKTASHNEAMQDKQEDNVVILKNFLRHNKGLKDPNIGELHLDIIGEGDPEPNIASNLLTLQKAKFDPDTGDSKRLTPLHIAGSKGHEDSVLVLLKHACNVHAQDKYVTDQHGMPSLTNTFHFRILCHCSSISNSSTKELLTHGLNVDSKNRQIAMMKNHVDMINLLLLNGNSCAGVGYPSRVIMYKGHPVMRKNNCCMEAGRVMRLPSSIEDLKIIAGAEIDSIEVIRDNDKLFIVEAGIIRHPV
ncbi:hypothetical protein MKW94_020601 [Papaver nudicaule]|uniref:Cyclic nucleotide-binding domain-containing protein n=1 Tax=Papaver nudicaule TaxID=74823 RepID=A0AA41VQB1_PAPNU|nr:hypothetical protein [Papaver nudicaule]